MIALPGVAALAAVLAEWLALGWVSGIDWPEPSAPAWARWPLRLLVGAMLQGLGLLLLALVGAPTNVIPLGLAAAGALALLVRGVLTALGAQRMAPPAPALTEQALELRELLGWLVLMLVLLGAWARAWLVPEAGWDAYSHWGLKAQAYVMAGAIVDTHGAHEYYPPLIPLLEAWLYAHRGLAEISLAKTIWPAIGSAFALCLTYHARLALRRAWLAPWLALGCVLLTTQYLDNFWTGQADLALTSFLSLGVLALFRWQTADAAARRGWLAQASMLFAGAALCKFEGLFRVAVPCVALLLELALLRKEIRRYLLAAVICGGVALLCFAPWAVYRQAHGFVVSDEHVSHFQPQALPGVLRTLAVTLGGIRTGGGIVVAALGAAVTARMLVRPPWRFIAVTTLGQVAATLLAFLITDYSPELQVSLSATRLFMQLLPPALFAVLVGLEQAVAPSGGLPEGRRYTRRVLPGRSMLTRRRIFAAALAALTVFASACGGSAAGTSPATTAPVKPANPTDSPGGLATKPQTDIFGNGTAAPQSPIASPSIASSPVASSSPVMGGLMPVGAAAVHVFLWGNPSTTQRDLQLAKGAGFTWVKQRFEWRNIEGKGKGQFEWQEPDRIVQAISDSGLKVVARLDNQPKWASSRVIFPGSGPPDNLQDWVDYVTAVATRYKGRIQAYEVWNEPNLSREWGDSKPDPAAYTQLLKASDAAIKAVDPQAIVITAGLSPTTENDAQAMPDVAYLQAMYAAGLSGSYDVLGVNAQSFKADACADPATVAASPDLTNGDPSSDTLKRVYAFRHVEDMRQVMVANGDSGKQVSIMEMGATTDARPNSPYRWFAETQQQQGATLVAEFTCARANWAPWIGVMTVIYIPDPNWTPQDEQFWWGITNPDGTPRPAYDALKRYLTGS